MPPAEMPAGPPDDALDLLELRGTTGLVDFDAGTAEEVASELL